jgi:vancomycin resistance protein VanW
MILAMRRLARQAVPFGLRVRWHQWRRHREWALHPLPWATGRGRVEDFPHVIDHRSSPLRRAEHGPQAGTAEGKERNLALGGAAVDGLIVAPGEVFSFCRTVGPTTRARGFVPGLEMHDEAFTRSPGGGLCQLANLLLGLAVASDTEIVERHRHSFDLFPDVDRTVPFGFGATVFYNHVDFQFRNRLPQPLLFRVWLAEGRLHGEARVASCPGWRIRVLETGHRFYRENDVVYRENTLWTQKVTRDGVELPPELLFTNHARVLYPADHLVES